MAVPIAIGIIGGVLFFRSFFCTSKRKNNHFSFITQKLLLHFLLGKQKKVAKKKAAKTNCSAGFGRPTHMKSHYDFIFSFFIEVNVEEVTACGAMYRKALSFSFTFIIYENCLEADEKEGAGKFFCDQMK